MTDLDELFHGLIDESARRREPLEQIESSAREFRRRDRRRHRAQGFLAGVVVIALVIGGVALVGGRGGDATPPASVGTTATTPTVHVPAGWHTYDYGLARLSIPPGWRAATGCPDSFTLLMDDPSLDNVGCGAGFGGPTMGIEVFAGRVASSGAHVNGIPYEVAPPERCNASACPIVVRTEKLHVQISFNGVVNWRAVLATLTYSTYARLLQHTFGPTPSTWKTISFDGYSVRVPREWSTYATAAGCGPSPNTAYYSNVSSASAGCAFLTAPSAPADSLQLFGGNALPAAKLGSHHGLRFGRLDAFGPFVRTLAYVVSGGRRPLIVTVGMGLDPAIARGILGSLRLAD